jgi:hypothetical protein
MGELSWLVLRCGHCLQCSGHRQQHGRCPHCGQPLGRDAELVKTVANGNELHLEVALANTPEALRDELRQRLGRGRHADEFTGEVSRTALFERLRAKAGEEGLLRFSDVAAVLMELDVEEHVESVMGQAEVEGLVLRMADGRWVFLE